MEDLNKLRYYLSKGDEIYENVDNESSDSDELLVIEENRASSSQFDTRCQENHSKKDLYKDFAFDEIKVIENCKNVDVKNALILNRKKIKKLQKLYNLINQHLQVVQTQTMQCKNSKITNFKIHMKYRLGMPYFKDKDMFSCPFNEDYKKMKDNNELPFQSYHLSREWSRKDKLLLASTVYKEICNNKKTELKKQLCNLGEEKNNVMSIEKELNILENNNLILEVINNWNTVKILDENAICCKESEIRDNISALENQLSTEKNKKYKIEINHKIHSLKKELSEIVFKNYIIKTVATYNKIDWFSVSCQIDVRHSDIESKVMWEQYMNPKNNKEPWSEYENSKLALVVQDYNMQNWDAIAEELNINKSAYQCCIHFFSKIWEKYRRDRWDKEEEEHLSKVVNMCRIGDFIPWSKVAKYFEDRTRAQIYSHYINCVSPIVKKGYFTISEDILLTALLRHFKSFVQAAYYFPNRTATQLRDRCKCIDDSLRTWSFEDDISILKHVEQYGERHWKNVSIEKNPACIRHRYILLKKWIATHPGESIEKIARREINKNKITQNIKNKVIIDSVANHLLEKIQNGENHESVFNIQTIQNITKHLNIKEKKMIKKPYAKRTTRIDDLILEFFKYSFKFLGRNRSLTDEVVSDSSNRVQILLDILGAKLNIPESIELENNPLLDELDVKILKRLSEKQVTNELPSTSTSNLNSVCKISLPPEPNTLIGFRSFMLHTATLKSHSNGVYHNIDAYLPEEKFCRINTEQTVAGEKIIDTENTKIIFEERELCRKRFETLFKWPAIMSLPHNEPPENPFLSSSSKNVEPVEKNIEAIRNESVESRVGRPFKVSPKILKMLEAKKRKRELIKSADNDAKKLKGG